MYVETCETAYVGSTTRTLETRAAEHRGWSLCSDTILGSPSQSSIGAHSEQCVGARHLVNFKDFKIINSFKSKLDLHIAESLYIFKLKPNLNETCSAFPLKIVNR